MGSPIRTGLIGIGNCASAFVQALAHYRTAGTEDGLLHPLLGNYHINDIAICCAFDIDQRKVGLDLADAIYAPPNNCLQISGAIAPAGVSVLMGPVLDGVPPHLRPVVEPASASPVDVAAALREAQADVVVNMIPTGSSEAASYYAQAALDAGVAVVNGMPARLARDPDFAYQAARLGIPVVGDDVKSQFGATIAHRALLSAMVARGIQIDRTYQLNYAGNTDFLNLLSRGESKKATKTAALQTVVPYDVDMSTGFAYLATLGDRKTAEISVEGRTFGSVPLRVRLTLEVEDSANFGGIIADAIRSCQIARDRGVGGVLESASAFLMKDPPRPVDDTTALDDFRAFIAGDRQR
jgi:myo-inositol-1-phosphate synthase